MKASWIVRGEFSYQIEGTMSTSISARTRATSMLAYSPMKRILGLVAS